MFEVLYSWSCRMWFRFAVGAALGVFASAVWAQTPDPVPLKNWPAPAYFQPATKETSQRLPAGEMASKPMRASPRTSTATSAPSVFVAMAPCRLMDTRFTQWSGPYGPPAMNANETRVLNPPTSANCPGIPFAAQAFSLNVTVVPTSSSGLGYLSTWPDGFQPSPLVSTLNVAPGIPYLANAAVVPAGNSGSFDVYVTNQTNVIIDINGYYVPAPGSQGVRVVDSAGNSYPFVTHIPSVAENIFYSGAVFEANGMTFLIPLLNRYTVASVWGTLWFTGTNCTGWPYLYAPDSFGGDDTQQLVLASQEQLFILNSTLYYPGPLQTGVTLLSYTHALTCTNYVEYSVNANPAFTLDLTQYFVPPFHLQFN